MFYPPFSHSIDKCRKYSLV